MDPLKLAEKAELDGDLEKAAEIYEGIIKKNHVEDYPYDRLMIIYRKLRKFKDELRIINKGISMFEDYYISQSKTKAGRNKLTELSNAFLKSTGLKDKKGKLVYTPQPIARWQKRKEIVKKKLE